MMHSMMKEDKKREENSQQNKGACYICGDKNHFARQCLRRGTDVIRSNQNGQNFVSQGQLCSPVNGGSLDH